MFVEKKPEELAVNPFGAIGRQWMLVTAGREGSYNTMTASWGGLGVLWGKDVSFVFVRPQRYTLEFMDREDYYTLSFLPEQYREALNVCGTRSGREIDKAEETGLTPAFTAEAPYFEQAELVLVCRKLYRGSIEPEEFLDRTQDARWYGEKDYHKVFVGEIVKVLVKE